LNNQENQRIEQICKTVLVTKPTASFQKLRKSVDRQAALVAFGLSASSAKEYADKLKDFTDEQFNQIVTGATASITKTAVPEESSVDMTVQILKAKYGV
jgi:Flp pilus assembly CpaF family ATPase